MNSNSTSLKSATATGNGTGTSASGGTAQVVTQAAYTKNDGAQCPCKLHPHVVLVVQWGSGCVVAVQAVSIAV